MTFSSYLIFFSFFLDLNLLSENLKGLYTGGEFCDVTLHVKNKEFKAHRIILAMRSSVFASYFKHETSEKQTGIIKIPDCDPDSFKDFLEYIYTGKLENTSLHGVLNLYRTAEKYNVQALKMFCIEYIKLNLNTKYFCNVVVLAEDYDDANLLAAAQNFFNRNLSEIFATAEWKNLMKSNNNLANSLLMQMSKRVQVVEKRPRLE